MPTGKCSNNNAVRKSLFDTYPSITDDETYIYIFSNSKGKNSQFTVEKTVRQDLS